MMRSAKPGALLRERVEHQHARVSYVELFFDLVFVFAVAIIYGAIFYKTRSIVGITLNHGLSNTMLFIVMPFYNLLLYLPF